MNLIPRNDTPVGLEFAASTVVAVQTMLVDVAAIAVVPPDTRPVVRNTSVPYAKFDFVDAPRLLRCPML